MFRRGWGVIALVAMCLGLPAGARAAVPARADRNHDKIFDDLAAHPPAQGRTPVEAPKGPASAAATAGARTATRRVTLR